MLTSYINNHNTLKIQLGSGPHKIDGWFNTDLNANGDPDIFPLDVTNTPYPIDGNTFDYVFCEHMIEHISYIDGLKMLKECFRILKPGGKIRIVTPDINFLIELYLNKENKVNAEYTRWATLNFSPWANEIDPIFVVNNFVRDWGHTFIYDKKTISSSLKIAGFRLIEELRICESHDNNLCNLENPSRLPDGFLQLESLCIEATK